MGRNLSVCLVYLCSLVMKNALGKTITLCSFPEAPYWKYRLCIVDFIIMLEALSPEVLLPVLILNCCYFAV